MTRDAEARARIESDLDRSLLVEAAAGTGKTTALVRRIVRLVATGRARLPEIAAITFTERASGELVLRLRERLETARESASDPGERARLEEALADFEAAYVGTIHGFCAELLRARPLDAGVDPAFTLLADDERSALLDETTDRFLERALTSPPEGLRRAIARPRDFEPPPPRQLFAREIRELVDHRDQTPALRREPFEREREIDQLLSRIEALAAMRAGEIARSDRLGELLERLGRFAAGVHERERTRPRDHDALERELVALLKPRGLDWESTGRGKMLGETPRADVIAARDALRVALGDFEIRADADLAFCLARDLVPAVADYEARKRSLGVLDHLDSLLRARALLAESRGARLALRERFRFLFVDEVQDVDPVQKDVILLLAGADPDASDPRLAIPRPGSLYLVGDPKQAIYGFRRADLRTYVALKEQLTPAHADLLELGASHRPRPAIAALVNAAFAPVLDGSEGQAGYVALEAQRPAMKGFPSVIALPAPRALGQRGGITRTAVDGSLPDAIASFVHWLLHESGLEIEDPITGAPVPLAPHHIGLLFRTLRDRGTAQARALERWGVPHSFVAPEAFFERETVIATSALASAIEWPDDALSVYATLRGPFVGATDAELFAYRETIGPLHPLTRPKAEGLPRNLAVIHDALGVLAGLHRGRHAAAIETTLGTFFERAEVEVLHLLAGDRAEARTLEPLRQLARRADARGATFRDFAHWLAERVADPSLGGVETTGAEPEPTRAVSISTVHGAKGLELPVIVICDPSTRTEWQSGPSRYVDAERGVLVRKLGHFAPVELRENLERASAMDRAESLRLLYVAATRARDVLVIPTVGLGEIEGSWMAPLAKALVPADPRGEVTRWATLPELGDRTMLDEEAAGPGVRPGHHASHLEGHGVTWWDPAHLLRPIPARAVHGHTHLVHEVPGRATTDDDRTFDADRRRVIEDASFGSLEVRSARAYARTPGAAVDALPIEEIAIGPAGGEGARFGRLVRDLAIAASPSEVDAAALARVVGATPEERDAALALAQRFHAHEAVTRWQGSPGLACGVPYLAATDTGPVVWGRAPLVAVEESSLVVVGLALAAMLEPARAELRVAASALARARGLSPRAVLLVAS
ncbi:MAG: UvrD-helicase domain-containing protein [Sandaracinus sp.]